MTKVGSLRRYLEIPKQASALSDFEFRRTTGGFTSAEAISQDELDGKLLSHQVWRVRPAEYSHVEATNII
jgi:hypothetical protein